MRPDKWEGCGGSLDGLERLRPELSAGQPGALKVADLVDARQALDREYQRFDKWQRVAQLPDVRSRWRRFWDRRTGSGGAR